MILGVKKKATKKKLTKTEAQRKAAMTAYNKAQREWEKLEDDRRKAARVKNEKRRLNAEKARKKAKEKREVEKKTMVTMEVSITEMKEIEKKRKDSPDATKHTPTVHARQKYVTRTKKSRYGYKDTEKLVETLCGMILVTTYGTRSHSVKTEQVNCPYCEGASNYGLWALGNISL